MSYTLRHDLRSIYTSIFRRSPSHQFNNIDWYIRLGLENGNVVLELYSEPQHSYARPGVPWEIKFDVYYKIKNCSKSLFNRVHRKHKSLLGVSFSSLLELKEKDFLGDDGDQFISIEVYNIRTVGLRKFKCHNFVDYPVEETYDMFLLIANQKIYCHSQILQNYSLFFRKIIEKTKLKASTSVPPSIILDRQIPVDEFLELLHHIYFPSDNIDDYNLATLLHWGTKFDVIHVLELCQQKIESCFDGCSRKKKLEQFLLVWRYSIEPLKKGRLGFRHYTFENIRSSEHYHQMDEGSQLELLKLVVKTSTPKAPKTFISVPLLEALKSLNV